MNVVNSYYDDRFWDGRGTGMFYHEIGAFFGVNWNLVSLNRLNLLQKVVVRIGSIIDKIVFHYHWEARLKRSGIVIFVLEKLE